MTYEQMVKKIKTAGTWFVGSFMGEFLINYPEFCKDVNKKIEFIKYIHEEYGVSLEYTYGSTKTKCYAVIAIIENGKVIDALEYVLRGNDKKIFDGAKENAHVLIDEIQKGRIKLPK